ncbi:hypothetical protein [Streptomyces sp. NPDC056191]|uniref:hypothetical protein n=1 Tax=Streptomyces sp. NPDC056191 TaxID=3345742 RepID=UPI0035E03B7A
MHPQTYQQAPAPAPTQGTHHWILTLEAPHGSGKAAHTAQGSLTPAAGYTRANAFTDLYNALVERNPKLRGATVVFFSVEPNAL